MPLAASHRSFCCPPTVLIAGPCLLVYDGPQGPCSHLGRRSESLAVRAHKAENSACHQTIGSAAEQCAIAAGASGVAEGALAIGPFTGALFALAGGAVVWGLVQAVDPVFTLPKELANLPAPVHLLNAQAESGKRANLYSQA
jgi:hypothetical protein